MGASVRVCHSSAGSEPQGCFASWWSSQRGFPGGSVVKNPPSNAEDAGVRAQSPGQEGPLEEVVATHSSTLAWRIPRPEEPGRATQSVGSQSRTQLSTHEHAVTENPTLHLPSKHEESSSFPRSDTVGGHADPCATRHNTKRREPCAKRRERHTQGLPRPRNSFQPRR